MKKGIGAKAYHLFIIILLFFCACGGNATGVRRPYDLHDRHYLQMRQPGKNTQALAKALESKAFLQCERAWFYNVWVDALLVRYDLTTDETVGKIVFYCRGRQSYRR